MVAETHGNGDGPVEVNALGMPCPRPVIELANAVRDVPIGTRLLLIADDPAAKVDIPVWCRMQGQTLVERRERDDGALTFLVEKVRELT